LLALRVGAGVFSAGLMTMPMTIIRDRFSGDRMARVQSLVAMVFMAVPMLAPLLGQGLLIVSGWRSIFGAMAVLSLLVMGWTWLRLPETLKDEYRQPMRPRMIIGNMWQSLTHRGAMGYFLGFALIQAAILGYINSAQQLVAEALGAGVWFPTIFGVMAFLMAACNFVNSRIVERFGARRVSHTALVAYIVVAAAHAAIAFSGRETLFVFVALMTPIFGLMAFLGSNFQSIALQPFAHIAGSASSVLSFIRVVTGTYLGIMIGMAFDGTARPVTLSMLAAGVGALALVAFSEKGRLFRRKDTPQHC